MERTTKSFVEPAKSFVENEAHPNKVDVPNPKGYANHLVEATAAICTLGVGQPSKVSREDYLKIDRDAVLAFGQAARDTGSTHFQLLSSVGANSESSSFYLRSKGQLEDGLRSLGFDRLSLFHPSMILTPTNRYGWAQAVSLTVWPWLKPILSGPLKKFRGIEVQDLGRAVALNLIQHAQGTEILEWQDITGLIADSSEST